MGALRTEAVTHVHHWTDRLFSFRTTRDPGFRFINGQFTMLGLEVAGRPLLRPYSMASSNYDPELEFFSKVANGPLTSRLQYLKEGNSILIGSKPTGTLIQDNLLPGEILYLLGTGTGMAPFMSIIKDPDTYDRFRHVVLVHGCRFIADLAYSDYITSQLPNDEFLGEAVRTQFLYYPTVTREPFRNTGRITALLRCGKLQADLGIPPLDRDCDRVMLCGSPAMLAEVSVYLEEMRFEEGSRSGAAHCVVEKAFVEK